MHHDKCHVLRVVALFVALLLPLEAQAAKETFKRSKPHVNVGTIGHVNRSTQSLLVTLSLVGLPGANMPSSPRSPAPPCSGTFDIRIRDASNLGAMPLFEETAVVLRADESVVVESPPDPSSGLRTPLLWEVTANGERIDGQHCIFRGLVEVRDQSGGCPTQTFALSPEDFILLP